MNKTQLAIIGSGPAGYAAAIYTARDRVETTMIGGIKTGGQLMFTTLVENYPGFADGVMGPALMMSMRSQAEKFGTKIIDKLVTAVDFSSTPFKLWTSLPDGTNVQDWEGLSQSGMIDLTTKIKQSEPDLLAEAVIITTGAKSIMLGIKGEKELLGKGIATCAVCDAAFYRDKKVYVVGGGDSAMEDTLALTKFAREVLVVHRRDSFKASQIMQERVLSNPKVKVLWNSEVIEAVGTTKLEKIKIKNLQSGAEVEEVADGLFYAIGHKPMSDIFRAQIDLDAHGYITTGMSLTKAGIKLAESRLDEKNLIHFPTMTSKEGVFAAGDVVDVRFKQAISAAGMGAAAALDCERYLQERNK